MIDNVQDAMLEILKRIQADVGDVKSRVGRVETHMGKLETEIAEVQSTLRKMRRDQAGMLVMMRATAGDFDERVRELEECMDAFDAEKN